MLNKMFTTHEECIKFDFAALLAVFAKYSMLHSLGSGDICGVVPFVLLCACVCVGEFCTFTGT